MTQDQLSEDTGLPDQTLQVEMQPVFCKDCQHVLGRRTYTDNHATWRCAADENINSTRRNLVSGELINEHKFKTCIECREDIRGCGPSGRWFHLYVYPTTLYHPAEDDDDEYNGPKEDPNIVKPISDKVAAIRARAAVRTSKNKLTQHDLENL